MGLGWVQPGGGGGGVTSFNGRTGAVVPMAGDYTAAQVGALPISGGTMTGNIDMGGNNLIGAGGVASTGTVSGSAMTASTFNGVGLTDGGVAGEWLDGTGGYTTPTASDVGADPAGTAASAVSAHEALADPHTGYLLADGSRALGGDLDLGGNDLTSGGTVTADLTGDVNNVTLATGGSAGDSLRADGTYDAVQTYGSTFEAPAISLVPVSISGAGFTPILSATTSVLPAGTYELQWYSALTFSSAGGRAAARVQVDFGGGMAPFSDIIGYQAGDNTGQAIAPAEPLPFTLGGDQTITVQIEAQDTGTGTAANQRTQFQIVRTS